MPNYLNFDEITVNGKPVKEDEKVDVVLYFNEEEFLNEYQFEKDIIGIDISIVVRDCEQGRSGQGSPHRYTPSIKIKGNNHANSGDPIYFSSNGKPDFRYEGKTKLKLNEKRYLMNFIKHNYINLMKYWFTPENIKDFTIVKKLQRNIENRIRTNINTYDYNSREEFNFDEEVFY